jgi:hypothetical protein
MGQITKPINDCLTLNSVGIENLIQIIQKQPKQVNTCFKYVECMEAKICRWTKQAEPNTLFNRKMYSRKVIF